jgi:lipopolysaccharide/colanic/teichoic acid biosynthesis glycosyltransferase
MRVALSTSVLTLPPSRPADRSIHDRFASGLRFSHTPAAPAYADSAGKRLLDIVLALTGLIVLAPTVLLLAAVLIRLTSPGPVLFVQQRCGRHGRLFPLIKLRTMHVHACDRSGLRLVAANDARTTAVGRWLRRYNIDELPQLLNVLAGHMSLVGPRPHVPAMRAAGLAYDELVPCYRLRHAVRPGLSGWAQVNGYRGPTTDAARAIARIDHDIAYIQNASPALDIRIMLMTLYREFCFGSGS